MTYLSSLIHFIIHSFLMTILAFKPKILNLKVQKEDHHCFGFAIRFLRMEIRIQAKLHAELVEFIDP
jgi:uncharacterized membrane protein YagU involved in acid resistance